VLDPVLRSSSGATLLVEEALDSLRRKLLPLVDCITPNRAELSALTGRSTLTRQDAEDAARELASQFPQLAILCTGGDQDVPEDLLLVHGDALWLTGERIETSSTHGTGCAFSSALAVRLALGDDLPAAASAAKAFVAEALRRAPGVGKGTGPLDLLWPLR
jgi:hydroxymethylpyrimidine/phosphomethylpyrimidine kinase